jgi:hypothetical protein
MGAWGSFNPWPFEFGGGPTDEESIYNALRSAVGEGGSAKKDDGIDGLWRACCAGGLAALGSFAERAATQAFPNLATDHIPVYEELYGITPPEGATDEDRRQVIAARYVDRLLADEPDLAVALADIDVRATLVAIPPAISTTVQLGKAFEPQDGFPTYGGARLSTGYPNFSSDFYVPVLLTIATTLPTPVDLTSINALKRHLREALPAWVDFDVLTSTGPFILDVSPLDLTAMS